MADTGWLTPATTKTKNYLDRAAWSNTDNIKTSNNTYASADVSSGTKWLVGYDFSASLSADATVVGVEVIVEGYVTQATNLNVILVDASSESEISVTDGIQSISTSDAEYTFGGSTSMWGASSYSIDNINDLGVAVRFQPNAGDTGYIDHIKVKIYYNSDTSQVIFIGV
jgi:hypothetical protein